MKSTTIEKQEKHYQFPLLMQSTATGLIVLFTEYEVGTAVTCNKLTDIGHYSEFWSMETFEVFDGQVTLEND